MTTTTTTMPTWTTGKISTFRRPGCTPSPRQWYGWYDFGSNRSFRPHEHGLCMSASVYRVLIISVGETVQFAWSGQEVDADHGGDQETLHIDDGQRARVSGGTVAADARRDVSCPWCSNG